MTTTRPLSPELSAAIAARLADYLADRNPRDRHLHDLAQRLQALPLDADMGGVSLLKADGTVLEVHWADDSVHESDSRRRLIALVAASKKYPELKVLLPSRSPADVDCAACAGSGTISALQCGTCGGLGWMSAPFVEHARAAGIAPGLHVHSGYRLRSRMAGARRDPDAPKALKWVRSVLRGSVQSPPLGDEDVKMLHVLLRSPVDIVIDDQSFRALWPESLRPQFYLARLAPAFFGRLLDVGGPDDSGRHRLDGPPVDPTPGYPFHWRGPRLDFWLFDTAAGVECRLRAVGDFTSAPPQFRQPREGQGPALLTSEPLPCPHCSHSGLHRRLQSQPPWLVCQSCGRSFREN